MKNIISRLTMMRLNKVFIDHITGEWVYVWQDKYGEFWLASSRFGFRVKY